MHHDKLSLLKFHLETWSQGPDSNHNTVTCKLQKVSNTTEISDDSLQSIAGAPCTLNLANQTSSFCSYLPFILIPLLKLSHVYTFLQSEMKVHHLIMHPVVIGIYLSTQHPPCGQVPQDDPAGACITSAGTLSATAGRGRALYLRAYQMSI